VVLRVCKKNFEGGVRERVSVGKGEIVFFACGGGIASVLGPLGMSRCVSTLVFAFFSISVSRGWMCFWTVQCVQLSGVVRVPLRALVGFPVTKHLLFLSLLHFC